MDLSDALRTTGAVREFRPEPVPDDVLYGVLETARFAPSGGNRQGWRVIVVKDQTQRTALRDLYLPGWYEYLAQTSAGLVPWAPITDREAEEAASAKGPELAAQAAKGPGGFAEHLDQVPMLLLLLADLRVLAAVDRDHPRYTFAGAASVYPFAWSVLLSARSVGLGGVMTTMTIRHEPEVKELFDIPTELAVAGVIALGYPVRQLTRLKRSEVEDFTTVDRANGVKFTKP